MENMDSPLFSRTQQIWSSHGCQNMNKVARGNNPSVIQGFHRIPGKWENIVARIPKKWGRKGRKPRLKTWCSPTVDMPHMQSMQIWVSFTDTQHLSAHYCKLVCPNALAKCKMKVTIERLAFVLAIPRRKNTVRSKRMKVNRVLTVKKGKSSAHCLFKQALLDVLYPTTRYCFTCSVSRKKTLARGS